MGETLRRMIEPERTLVKTTPPAFFLASPTTAENTILAILHFLFLGAALALSVADAAPAGAHFGEITVVLVV